MGVPILSLIGAVGDIIAAPIKGWQERKGIKLESDKRIAEAVTQAKIKRLETGQQADIKWENLSIDNAGWKDDFWTIIIGTSVGMCFHPAGAIIVTQGFAALATTPVWYQTLIGVAVGSAFGVRTFTNFRQLMKGD